MCKEVVLIDDNVRTKMDMIYPKDMPKEYHVAYEELVKQHVMKNKDKERTIEKNRPISKGIIGTVYHATFLDVILARKQFVDLFL